MKNFKKIASAIAALSLAACVAVPMSATVFTASAVEYTISSPTSDKGSHTYAAYQIFSGTLSVDEAGKKVLTGIEWGTGVDQTKTIGTESDAKNLLAAVKAISLPKEGGGNEAPFEDAGTAAEIAKILGEKSNGEKDAPIAKAFADVVEKYLKTEGDNIKITSADGKLTINTAGYYLIKDESEPTAISDKGANTGAYTRFMLQVLDPAATSTELTIAAKQAAPSVDKQVLDNDTDANKTDKTKIEGQTPVYDASANGVWGETADHEIGETFQFKLKAQLPDEEEINNYKAYKLVFHDTMSKGVDYLGNLKLTCTGIATDITFAKDDPVSEAGATETGKIKKGTEEVGSYVVKTSTDGSKTLDITINDVKKLGDNITLQNLAVEVVYDAKLNKEAEVETYSDATSNKNAVKLEYSNNPNTAGSGTPESEETGETPEDIVWIYTYEVDSTKVDGANTNTKLSGAKFKLYKKESGETKYAVMEESGTSNTSGIWTIKEWTKDANSATEMETPEGGKFNVKGLDAGAYYIKETEAPKGYNTLEEDIMITISANHEETANSNKVTLSFAKGTDGTPGTPAESTSPDSVFNNQIENNKGATLPSTGGIGTTLFYLGGGALVAVAGVMLITKKRMTKE